MRVAAGAMGFAGRSLVKNLIIGFHRLIGGAMGGGAGVRTRPEPGRGHPTRDYDRESARAPSDERSADRRDEQRQANGVGEEARREQQDSCNQDQSAMSDRADWITPFGEVGLELAQGLKALSANEGRSCDRRQDHDCQGRPEPDEAADLNEQGDLEDRHRHEEKKQGHDVSVSQFSVSQAAAMDTSWDRPYIGPEFDGRHRLLDNLRG